MSMDLTGITNKNEYYTNHYFSTVFEENTRATISGWNAAARESEEIKTPWSLLRQNARQYYTAHDKFVRSSVNLQVLANIKALVGNYLKSLGYPEAKPEVVAVDDSLSVPVYLEMTKSNGAPLLWVLLSASKESDAGIMESFVFNANDVDDDAAGTLYKGVLGEIANEDLVTKILFGTAEPPRFVMLIGMNQIALIDRNKWNEKRYLQFELEEIFSRLENTTLQAMSVLLHKDSLCPDDGKVLLDELDEQSQKNASGVSQDLKYALRESIELLGNEVLYDMKARLGRDLDAEPVDAGQLTLECLRYMYRMLFVLFIESRPELGYAPIKAQSYYSGYSLESLRDIADNIRDDVNEVGDGYYLHETLAKLYELIYDGYPKTEDELKKATGSDSLHDMFLIAPLKAHIFDPEYTKMITAAKLRNSCMLRIIDLMSLTRATGRKNGRRGRISYANLGINQMGAVYEALLSYRGFIAEHDLYEVKRAGDSFNELDVGYFVSESELEQYTEDERVRYEPGEKAGKLRMYEKGTFIYRLAGREREKSASYYTPEVLTKCLVKYALKELLEGKTADEILKLTICEPAMGSAAFLNEAINQLAEAYISRKEKETGEIISYKKRFNELQKVKMFIADRNVYGIDLNPVAVELAEVSLWLNTIYEGGFVPWFGTQLVNGNSLIGARRQVYRIENAQSTSKGLRWYEMEPDRVPLGTKRMPKKQVYHFLLGDPGMCSYTDKVIKQLEPANIKEMKDWNKKFISPFTYDEVVTLLRLSAVIDELWEAQIQLRKEVGTKTQDALSIFGYTDDAEDSHTTIRQKDKIFSELYKSEHMKNAGPYARLKFAMDYWCALWFWPIDKANLLPTRSEFLFDMSLILEGTTKSVLVTDTRLGVPEVQLDLVRSFVNREDFYKSESAMPHDVYEHLSWLAEGFPMEEVLELVSEEQNSFAFSEDLAAALDVPTTLKSFVVVDGEDELRRIMAEPLEKWRVFLHPTQRKIVQKEYSGSARVLGGAGTGKTVVAMHRAKHLASKCEGQQRILMTTFTANLAADIRENLRKICTLEELRRIEVIHLDAWVNQFLRESGFSAQIGYDDVINPLWERAVLLANIDLPYETTFYEEEWNRIVIAQEALTLEKYVKATRNGRGTRLDRKKRMQVWKVFENYQNLMKENQIRDINTAMYESTKLLQSAGRKPRYASIIIDEGQDFSDNAYRLIRALAGEEHPNDIFIVGDSHQRIYRNYPTLSKCGINVRGRSSILKINYRTTEEIRKHAFALLNGISFDDLDEDLDLGDKCQSLTHGEKPIVENFENANDEFDFLLREVKKLKENGVSLTDICVVARTKKLVDDYIALFIRAGIRSYAIKRNKVDDRSFDGLRVATMHRVKGLEFKYVFIAAVNNRIIPLPFAINKTDAVSEVESITSEKCLLYVAMTRAQKGVYITSYGRPSEFLV